MTEYDNMELKYNCSLPRSESAKLSLFTEFLKLKALYRQGWIKAGIDRKKCESVAEHSFMVALISMIFSDEKGLDTQKVIKMALLHEAGEISAGDITPGDEIPYDEKQNKERESVKKLFSKLENKNYYIYLWEELENKESREAQLVKQVDSLELAMQAKIYEKIESKELSEFFHSAENNIHDPVLADIFEKIKKI